MDFGKVKILLIVVFLALNLFLAYQWSILSSSVTTYAEPLADQVANLERMFATHHVTLATALPTSPEELPMLAVSVPNTELSGSQVVSVSEQFPKGPTVLKHQGHTKVLEKWLTQQVADFADYELYHSEISHDSGVFEYWQTTNNLPVFSAPLDVMIQAGKVTAVRKSYVLIRYENTPRPVVTAVNALLALSSYMDKVQMDIDNTILGMQLGYQSSKFVNGKGYLAPVWRITSQKGIFYINALSGEVSVQDQ